MKWHKTNEICPPEDEEVLAWFSEKDIFEVIGGCKCPDGTWIWWYDYEFDWWCELPEKPE